MSKHVGQWSLALKCLLCQIAIVSSSETVFPPVCGKTLFIASGVLRPTPKEKYPAVVPHIKEFPFVVSIHVYLPNDTSFPVDDGAFVGILLSRYLVLTTCSCVVNEFEQLGPPHSLRIAESFGVTAGTVDSFQLRNDQSQFRWAWKIQVHPKCAMKDRSFDFVYDLATMVVRVGFTLIADRVESVPTLTFNFHLDDIISTNDTCVMLGWGWAEYGISDIGIRLMKPVVRLLPTVECAELPNSTSDVSCQTVQGPLFTGDHGSPIVCGKPISEKIDNTRLVGMRNAREAYQLSNGIVVVAFTRFDDKEAMKWIENEILNHVSPPPDSCDSCNQWTGQIPIQTFCWFLILTRYFT